MRVWEGLVARHQRRTALKIRRAAAKHAGLDTALRLCPEWYDTEEECATCRKRRRRRQAAPHALAQDVERVGMRMSEVAAATSGEQNPQRLEEYAVAIADCREARRRLRQARVADLGDFQEAQRRQGEALVAECTAALQRAYDFLLAEALHPDEVWQAAAQVLIPVPLLPRRWQAPLTPWISVHETVEGCSRSYDVRQSLIYEVYLLDLLTSLRESTAAWPQLQRQAVAVYCVHQFGIDFTNTGAMRELDGEAAEALREAQQALYDDTYDEECDDTYDESE